MNALYKIIFFLMHLFSMRISFAYIPAQVKAFKKAIAHRPVDIINCSSCDFRGVQTFAGLDAHGVYMAGATFQPCVKTAANKNNPLMICIENQAANLKGINLAGANIASCCFNNAILDEADLTGADFSNGSAIAASFKNAKLTGLICPNSTFCNAVMPDGQVCSEKLGTWTGQGVTIPCGCQKGSPKK